MVRLRKDLKKLWQRILQTWLKLYKPKRRFYKKLLNFFKPKMLEAYEVDILIILFTAINQWRASPLWHSKRQHTNTNNFYHRYQSSKVRPRSWYSKQKHPQNNTYNFHHKVCSGTRALERHFWAGMFVNIGLNAVKNTHYVKNFFK